MLLCTVCKLACDNERLRYKADSYSRFSHDVTAAMFVPLNKEMAAIFVSRPNPLGIELYYYANVFFCFR